jgi:hypothetical protein
MSRADTAISKVGPASDSDDAFDEEKAKNDAAAFRQLESVWDRWLKLSTFRTGRQSAEHTTGID